MSARNTVSAILLALLCATVPFVYATRDLADLELRTRPYHARPGAIVGSADVLPRQRFRSPSDGLERIEVSLARATTAGDELELRLIDRDAIVRTVRARFETSPDRSLPFARFSFEPLDDSGGREFAFELAPVGGPGDGECGLAPWIRARRMLGIRDFRGDIEIASLDAASVTTFEGGFKAQWGRLSGVDLAVAVLPAGPARFELFEGDSQAPLRVVERPAVERQRGGSALFVFEPIERSRWGDFRWRATLPAGALLVGASPHAPAIGQYFGPARADGDLGGAVGVGWPVGEADIVFRTFARGRSGLADVAERMGWRAACALVLWCAAVASVLAAWRRAR